MDIKEKISRLQDHLERHRKEPNAIYINEILNECIGLLASQDNSTDNGKTLATLLFAFNDNNELVPYEPFCSVDFATKEDFEYVKLAVEEKQERDKKVGEECE